MHSAEHVIFHFFNDLVLFQNFIFIVQNNKNKMQFLNKGLIKKKLILETG